MKCCIICDHGELHHPQSDINCLIGMFQPDQMNHGESLQRPRRWSNQRAASDQKIGGSELVLPVHPAFGNILMALLFELLQEKYQSILAERCHNHIHLPVPPVRSLGRERRDGRPDRSRPDSPATQVKKRISPLQTVSSPHPCYWPSAFGLVAFVETFQKKNMFQVMRNFLPQKRHGHKTLKM